MSVYKEAFMIIDELTSQQEQIYPDACDYGVLVKEGDHNWNLAKQLADWYGIEGSRHVTKYTTGTSVEIFISVMWEWDDTKEFAHGEELTFHMEYHTVKDRLIGQHVDGYITIEQVSCYPGVLKRA